MVYGDQCVFRSGKLFKGCIYVLVYLLAASIVLGGSVHALSAGDVVDAIGQARNDNNREVVIISPALMESAQAKAEHMCKYKYWSHVAPDGTTPWKFFIDYDYSYQKSAENLSAGYDTSMQVVNAWLASTSHKGALLDASYQDVGVSAIHCDVGRGIEWVVVAHFGAPKQESIEITSQARTKSWFARLFTFTLLGGIYG